MLYVSLTDSSLEIIQTKRVLFQGEKISSSSRKELPQGLIKDGMILDSAKLTEIFTDTIKSGYPKEIVEKDISLIIPDDGVCIRRISIPPSIDGHLLSKSIIEELKKDEKVELKVSNNFYKVTQKSTSEKEILYMAVPLSVVSNYLAFFKKIDFHLKSLIPSSLAIFRVISPFIKPSDVILYCNIDKFKIEFNIFDQYGPVSEIEKKSLNKQNTTADIRNAIKKQIEQSKKAISQLYFAGEGALEQNQDEIKKSCGAPITILNDLVDSLFKKENIDFDTGGVIKCVYVNCLGALFSHKDTAVPNFYQEVKNKDMSQSQIVEDNSLADEKEKQDIKENLVNADKSFGKENIPLPQIVEYQRSGIFRWIFSRKLIIIIIIFILFGILGIGYLSVSNLTNIKTTLPFLAGPTVTLTPTLVPTLTPTPTLDPKLKRSEVKISIQNGTTITGYAKDIAEILDKKGYLNVAKSNADKEDYENNIISAKETKKKYLPLIKSDLSEKIRTFEDKDLDDNSQFDIIIILGNKKD